MVFFDRITLPCEISGMPEPFSPKFMESHTKVVLNMELFFFLPLKFKNLRKEKQEGNWIEVFEILDKQGS